MYPHAWLQVLWSAADGADRCDGSGGERRRERGGSGRQRPPARAVAVDAEEEKELFLGSAAAMLQTRPLVGGADDLD